MWICDNCETRNNEQDRFCVLCTKERQGEPSVAVDKENQSAVLPEMEQQSVHEQPIEPAAVPTVEEGWEDAPEAGAADTARMPADRTLAKSGVVEKGDLTPDEESHEEPLKADSGSISKKRFIITTLIVLAITVLVSFGIYMNHCDKLYNEAIAYYEKGTKEDLQKALSMLEKLGEYHDSEFWASTVEHDLSLWDRYEEAETAWKEASASGDLSALRSARYMFMDLRDFEDSEEREKAIKEEIELWTDYEEAEQALSEAFESDNLEELQKARDMFVELNGHADSEAKIDEIDAYVGYINDANEIDEKIDAVGSQFLDLSYMDSVNEIRRMYDDAPSQVKSRVRKLDELERLEQEMKEMKESVDKIEALIDLVDPDNVTVNDREAIFAAWDAYTYNLNGEFVSEDRVDRITKAYEAYKECCLQEGKRLLGTMRRSEGNGNTFYESPSQPMYINDRSFAMPYIGVRSEKIWMYWWFNHLSEKDIMTHKIVVYADGSEETYKFSKYNNGSHQINGYVKSYHLTVDPSVLSHLEKVAKANVAIVQFFDGNGNLLEEFRLSDGEKRGIQDMVDAFTYLIDSEKYYKG